MLRRKSDYSHCAVCPVQTQAISNNIFLFARQKEKRKENSSNKSGQQKPACDYGRNN